jgi:hypothetical protein
MQVSHRLRILPGLLLFAAIGLAPAAEDATAPLPAPTGNAYDVLGRVFAPFTNVLLSGGRDPNKAMALEMRIAAVEGRLPSQFQGAILRAWVENPDKLRLEAPVFGEKFIVTRNGDEVWAMPGDKVEFLLNQFKKKPPPSPKTNTPLAVPITAQQAIFLVALFDVENRDVAEVDEVAGRPVRVLTAGLQPDLASAAQAADFKASVWIDGEYRPRRIEIFRRDFSTLVDLPVIQFVPTLPPGTWQPPADATNVYRTSAADLEAVLYVVINSLHTDSNDKPWQHEQ